METSDYYRGLIRLWWLPLLSGLIFIGLGVWCLCAPVSFLNVMAYVFAGLFGAVGLFNLIYGIANFNNNPGWGWAVAGGIVEILFCFFLFFIPESILAYVFVYGVGLYVIFMAIYTFFEYFMAARSNGFWFFCIILLSLASIAFAIMFIVGPGASELVGSVTAPLAGTVVPAVIGWLWMGVSFLCYGAYRMILACRIKALNDSYKSGNF